MDKVTTRQQAVLDVLDEQIEELEVKLAKAQPIINELNRLKKTRQTLLAERSPTGGVGRKAKLTMEQVIHAFREHGDMSPNELADRTGVDPTIARSHLNRYRDQRYEQGDNGNWRLIGEEGDE